VVLSGEEVVRFLEAVPSLRNRVALTTAYGAGLRVGEVARLKAGAIDSSRMLIRIEHGKGGKDRYVMLSPQLLQILRSYWRLARPGRWLFPGQDPREPVSVATLQEACRQAARQADLRRIGRWGGARMVRCQRGGRTESASTPQVPPATSAAGASILGLHDQSDHSAYRELLVRLWTGGRRTPQPWLRALSHRVRHARRATAPHRRERSRRGAVLVAMKQRWTSTGPFGQTVLPLDGALRFVTSKNIFWGGG
jgi:hypothetical protein